MTFEECRLIRNGYHIWDPSEALRNSKIHCHSEDRMAHIKARRALSRLDVGALLSSEIVRRTATVTVTLRKCFLSLWTVVWMKVSDRC
jgi:hypothetical protein